MSKRKKAYNLITVDMPRKSWKIFRNEIQKDKVAGISFWGVRKDKDLASIQLAVEENVNIDNLNIGFALCELKYRTAARGAEIEAKKLKKVEPLKINIDKSISKEFKQLYGKKFNLNEVHADIKTGKVTYNFNVSSIKGRNNLAKYMFNLAAAVQACKNNERLRIEKRALNAYIKDLEQANNFDQTHIEYERMTGQELIDRGFVTIFDSDKKPAKMWQRVLNIFLNKQKKKELQYTFWEKVVELDKEYVIKHTKPIKLKNPRPINHIQMCLDIYDWGNQVHAGYGIMAVDKYYQEIVKINNEYAKANSK